MNYIKCNKKNKQTTAQRKLVKCQLSKQLPSICPK